jgi:hypothetical protein
MAGASSTNTMLGRHCTWQGCTGQPTTPTPPALLRSAPSPTLGEGFEQPHHRILRYRYPCTQSPPSLSQHASEPIAVRRTHRAPASAAGGRFSSFQISHDPSQGPSPTVFCPVPSTSATTGRFCGKYTTWDCKSSRATRRRRLRNS